MGAVLTHMTMSLDGFIANPDDSPGELFDWYWAGDVPVASHQEGMGFSVDEASAEMLRELLQGSGAMISGRRLFDITNGWDDQHPGSPRSSSSPTSHRLTPRCAGRGRRSWTAWRRPSPPAKQIAGDKDVTIASPDVIRQALDLGLVDEVCISLVPVLFGEGIPYFTKLDRGHLLLEDPVVIQGKRAVHLRYPVRRS